MHPEAPSTAAFPMRHPPRWRETCDPFALNFQHFRLREVLGYPHAGNDVFQALGTVDGEDCAAYIKVARQKGANIENEVRILSQLDSPPYPRVLDYDRESFTFSVTSAMPGLRLSNIVGDNADLSSLPYMTEYGEALGRLHHLQISAKAQSDRRFRHRPPEELLKKLDLMHLNAFFDRAPVGGATVFCHGDFHYANVLWENQHLSAILDFELSGYGDRDFDIAWALFLRPGQRFLKTEQEQRQFLNGYAKYGECNAAAVKYYMAQCYVYFLEFSGRDSEYAAYVRQWLAENCTVQEAHA